MERKFLRKGIAVELRGEMSCASQSISYFELTNENHQRVSVRIPDWSNAGNERGSLSCIIITSYFLCHPGSRFDVNLQ